jgi:replicative DNA helicase
VRHNETNTKPLPSATDAEKQIIGAIQLDNDMMAQATAILKSEDFYSPACGIIYKAMEGLYNRQEVIDPIMIIEQIKLNGDNLGGGHSLLADMTTGMLRFSEVEMKSHCRLVKKKAVARSLIKLCSEIQDECLSEEDDIEAVLESAEGRIMATSSELSTGTLEKAGANLSEIVPDILAQFQNYRHNVSNGVSTGMREVDEKLDGGGLQNGGLYVIGGTEKSGKTSLALDWAYDAAVKQGFFVDVITAEMNRVTLAKRLFSGHTGIPYSHFRPGWKGDTYLRALKELDSFGQIPIRIYDKLRTIGQIKRQLRRNVELSKREGQKPYGFAVVDYIQLLELDGAENNRQRTEVVGKVSRELKILSTELGIPIIAMSSLNRLGLSEGAIADSHNLRDAGSIGFDAEALFMVHNPAYIPGQKYVPQPITPIDLALIRQRNGPTGDIKLMFIGAYMQFMTESQYRENLGNRETNTIPKSVGQKVTEDKQFDDLWEGTG